MNTTRACFVAGLFLAAVILLASPPAWGQLVPVHQEMGPYEGSKTCAACHPGKPAEVAGSLHYQQQAIASNVEGYETSSLGMATEYCGLPATIASINWLGLLQPADTSLAAQPGGCARCHVGTGAKPNPAAQLTQADYDGIDCLICHGPNYSRTVVSANGGFQLAPAPGVNSTAVAMQAQKPTSDMCLRCHLGSGGGPNFKHGVVPTPATDVHLAAGLGCVDCHTSSGHHTTGSGDLKAVDVPTGKVSCAKCHTAAPHSGNYAIYNTHAARIACQTCHIPLIARTPSIPTLVERDWTQPVLNPSTGLYDPKNVMGTNITPLYRWWNGKLQKYPPGPLGSIVDSGAKIFPWKHITTHVPADASTGKLLPIKAGVYSTKGDINLAVTTGVQQSGTPYSGGWTTVADELTFGVQHQVAPKDQALHCNSCHVAQGGRLDFAALGYSSDRVAFLQSSAPMNAPTLSLVNLVQFPQWNVLTLARPNNGGSYVLEGCASLVQPWETILTPWTTNGGMVLVTVTNAAQAQFYRLRGKP